MVTRLLPPLTCLPVQWRDKEKEHIILNECLKSGGVKFLKYKQFGVITLLLFSLVVAFTGIAMADQVVPAISGNQGITTQTVRIVDGLVMEQYNLALQISNLALAPNSSSTTLQPGQVQYTTAYDQRITAQGGMTTFVKDLKVSTANTVVGQSNVKADTSISFAATADGGNVEGEENLMLDGAGSPTNASDRMLCPFGSQPVDLIPAYCNILQAGSRFDLTVGEVATNANERFIGTDATAPVILNYNINVKPYGSSQVMIPATGSAMAYIKAHIQEGRTNVSVKAEDLTYSDSSSVQGSIIGFTKVIAYQSGKSLIG